VVKNSVLPISIICPPDTGRPASFTEDFSDWLHRINQSISVMTYTDGPPSFKYLDSIKIAYVHRYKNLPQRYAFFIWSILRNYD